jgi:hypothetical protein
MIKSQKVLLAEALTEACQQIQLLCNNQQVLSNKDLAEAIKLQWHNKQGEIKLAVHEIIKPSLFAVLDEQLDKVFVCNN